jgi:hypothetical protein
MLKQFTLLSAVLLCQVTESRAEAQSASMAPVAPLSLQPLKVNPFSGKYVETERIVPKEVTTNLAMAPVGSTLASSGPATRVPTAIEHAGLRVDTPIVAKQPPKELLTAPKSNTPVSKDVKATPTCEPAQLNSPPKKKEHHKKVALRPRRHILKAAPPENIVVQEFEDCSLYCSTTTPICSRIQLLSIISIGAHQTVILEQNGKRYSVVNGAIGPTGTVTVLDKNTVDIEGVVYAVQQDELPPTQSALTRRDGTVTDRDRQLSRGAIFLKK